MLLFLLGLVLALSWTAVVYGQTIAVTLPRADFEVTQISSRGQRPLSGKEDGLVAYWPLDEGEGRQFKEMKSGRIGQWRGAVYWENGVLTVGGGRVWGLTPYDPIFDAPKNDFSVAGFYKSTRPPVSNHAEVAVLMLNSESLFAAGWAIALRKSALCFVAGPTPDPHSFQHEFSVDNLFDGEWHCVAMTRKGEVVRCYFDGKEVGSFTSEGPTRGNRVGNLNIGGVENWALGLDGNIRDCSYWERALTPDEVAAMAAGTAALVAEISLPDAAKRQFSVRVLDSNGIELKSKVRHLKGSSQVAISRLPPCGYTLEVLDADSGAKGKVGFRIWRIGMDISPVGVLQGGPIGVRIFLDGPSQVAPRRLKLRVLGTDKKYEVNGAGEVDVDTAKLPPGDYEIELVDEELEFRKRARFQVWK